MTDELIRFKQIVTYKISQGENLTAIGKEAGLTWPTMDAIMKDKQTNFRASTRSAIQDFIRNHNSVGSHTKAKEETPEETNYGVLEFFVRVRELLQGVPKGYKCKIEIEKL